MTGVLALTAAFAVVGFGIATAIYLEQPVAPRTDRAPAVLTVPHDPTAAAAAVPARAESPARAALPEIEPEAGSSETPSVAAIEAPPLAPELPRGIPAPAPAPVPAAAAAAAPYWVEYGVFVGATHARRLQQQLARQGLDTVVVGTHGRDGRKLLRVRSAPLSGLAAARQAAGAAHQTLHLAALVHRGSPTAAPEAHYRVQFGAFARPQPAARLSRELRQHGITANVSAARGTSGKHLYFVQSTPVRGRDRALALAARGRLLTHSDALVESSGRSLPPAHAPRAPPRAMAEQR